MQWWRLDGVLRRGPFSEDEIRAQIRSGELYSDDMISGEGYGDWVAVSDIPEFSDALNSGLVEQKIGALVGEAAADNTTTHDLESETRIAGPWRRFIARFIDLAAFYTVFFALTMVLTAWAMIAIRSGQIAVTHPLAEFFSGLASGEFGFIVAGWLIGIVFFLILEIGTYAIFGTTLGKGVLGLQVENLRENKLNTREYAERLVGVHISGLGASIPFVAFFTQIYQFKRLSQGKPASYDEGSFRVVSKRLTILRWAAVFAVGLSMLFLHVFTRLIERSIDSGAIYF
ncbi:RDD family protein [Billgrantia montanilacus]|nr:RDD family protein [Halomonas montanilacus]